MKHTISHSQHNKIIKTAKCKIISVLATGKMKKSLWLESIITFAGVIEKVMLDKAALLKTCHINTHGKGTMRDCKKTGESYDIVISTHIQRMFKNVF